MDIHNCTSILNSRLADMRTKFMTMNTKMGVGLNGTRTIGPRFKDRLEFDEIDYIDIQTKRSRGILNTKYHFCHFSNILDIIIAMILAV